MTSKVLMSQHVLFTASRGRGGPPYRTAPEVEPPRPKFQKFPKTSERFQMLASASERVPTHPGRSEQVQTHLRTRENFENLAKTSRKFRERGVRAVVVFCVAH